MGNGKSKIGSLLARGGHPTDRHGSEGARQRAIGEGTNLTEFSIMEIARRVARPDTEAASSFSGKVVILQHRRCNKEGILFSAQDSLEVLRVP